MPFCFTSLSLSLSSPALGTTKDTRPKTQSDPVIATPEAAKAELYSGGVGYSYAIDLPPAAGITPDLQLSYSSLTGNTEYGKGWSLNLSKIERSTRTGPPTYSLPSDHIDEFEIDGSLVIPDPDDADTFHLEQMDHRRIRYNPPEPDDECSVPLDYWEVTDPDGTKYLYGCRSSANSQLDGDNVASPIPDNTFRWSLDKVIDPRGNYYYIDYAYETFDHLQPGGASSITYNMNNHPIKIRYSFHAQESGSRKRRIVEFQWDTMRGEADWNDDRPTSYRSGFKIQISERLSDILVGTDDDDDGAIDERIRRYQLIYTEKPTSANTATYTNPSFSQLEAIQRYGKTDADIFPTALNPKPTVFTYKPFTLGHAPSSVEFALPSSTEVPPGTEVVWQRPGLSISDDSSDPMAFGSATLSKLVDINGDGFTDLVAVVGNPPFAPPNDEYPSGGAEWWVAYGPVREGEKLEDAVNGAPDKWGFGKPERWKWGNASGSDNEGPTYSIEGNNQPYNDPNTYSGGVISRSDQEGIAIDLIDVNGDGLLDYVDTYARTIDLNLGDSACTDENNNPVGCFELSTGMGPWKIESIARQGQVGPHFIILATLADVNGDGLPDYVGASENEPDADLAYVTFNDGGDFSGTPVPVPLSDLNPGDPVNHVGQRDGTSGYNYTGQMFADVNGDGMADRSGFGTCLRGPVQAFSLGSGWQSASGEKQWFWDDSAGWGPPANQEYNFCTATNNYQALQPELQNADGTVGALIDLNGDGILDYYYFAGADPPDIENQPGVYFGLGDGSYLTVDDQSNSSLNIPWGIAWGFPQGYAIRHYNKTDGTIVQMSIEFIDMNGDGLQDVVYNPACPPGVACTTTNHLEVWFNPGPSGLLESVTNELGGVTTLQYKPSTWFRDKVPFSSATNEDKSEPALEGVRSSAPKWVLTNITTEDGRAGTPQQTQSIEYADVRYDYARHEYIGARMAESAVLMAESAEGDWVTTRSFFHQSKELRPRLEFTETEDENGNIVSTESTAWDAVVAKNRYGSLIDDSGGTPLAWFAKPSTTISTIRDPNPPNKTLSRTVTRTFNDLTGNLTQETDWGPDNTPGTQDDYTKNILQFNNPNFDDWLISYPYAISEVNPEFSLQRFYYDYVPTDSFNNPPTKGLLTKQESTQYKTASYWHFIIEKWGYDEFGNQTEYFDGRAVAAGETTPTRTTDYETDFQVFPLKITNAFGQFAFYRFDTDFGEVDRALDPNHYLLCWDYDAFGRLSAIGERISSMSLGASCDFTRADFSYPLIGENTSEQHILTTRYVDPNGSAPGIRSRSFIDGLGRVYQEESERTTSGAADFAITVRSWGLRGELTCESLPILGAGGTALAECGSGPGPVLQMTYDALLRPLDTTRSGVAIPEIERTYRIDDLDLKTGDELIETRTVNGSPPRKLEIGTDPAGRVVAVNEVGGGLTQIGRDAKGRVVLVDGPVANDSLAITYNHQDQRTKLSGLWGYRQWNYQYDNNGNLTQQISPAGKKIKFHWDKLNRLGVKDYGEFTDIDNPNPSEDIIYYYDNPLPAAKGIGRLASVTTPGPTSVDTSFTYSYKGQLKTKVRNFGSSGAFSFTYNYNRMGQRTAAILPNGVKVNYDYDGSVLKTIRSDDNGGTTIADNAVLHESGALKEINYVQIPAGQAKYTYYWNTYRLQSAKGFSSAGSLVQDLVFDYDQAGNLTEVHDGLDEFNQTFSYDALHRISTAESQRYPAPLNFTYDAAGNLKTKGQLTLNYASSNGGPHAVSSVTDPGYANAIYTYDFDGALTGRNRRDVDQVIARDDDGRIASITVGGTGFVYVYDETGERSRKTGPGIDTLYVDRQYEVDISAPANASHKVHYFYGSSRIATENRSGAGLPGDEGSVESWQYYYPDFVGSNSVVVKKDVASGVVDTQKTYFTPFGEFTHDSNGGGLSEYLFTGQENDPESGLMYYGARYYDPWVGRFLSQDPALIGYAAGASFGRVGSDPQEFNAYSYVANRPTVFTDPTGASRFYTYTFYYTKEQAAQVGLGEGEVRIDGKTVIGPKKPKSSGAISNGGDISPAPQPTGNTQNNLSRTDRAHYQAAQKIMKATWDDFENGKPTREKSVRGVPNERGGITVKEPKNGPSQHSSPGPEPGDVTHTHSHINQVGKDAINLRNRAFSRIDGQPDDRDLMRHNPTVSFGLVTTDGALVVVGPVTSRGIRPEQREIAPAGTFRLPPMY